MNPRPLSHAVFSTALLGLVVASPFTARADDLDRLTRRNDRLPKWANPAVQSQSLQFGTNVSEFPNLGRRHEFGRNVFEQWWNGAFDRQPFATSVDGQIAGFTNPLLQPLAAAEKWTAGRHFDFDPGSAKDLVGLGIGLVGTVRATSYTDLLSLPMAARPNMPAAPLLFDGWKQGSSATRILETGSVPLTSWLGFGAAAVDMVRRPTFDNYVGTLRSLPGLGVACPAAPSSMLLLQGVLHGYWNTTLSLLGPGPGFDPQDYTTHWRTSSQTTITRTITSNGVTRVEHLILPDSKLFGGGFPASLNGLTGQPRFRPLDWGGGAMATAAPSRWQTTSSLDWGRLSTAAPDWRKLASPSTMDWSRLTSNANSFNWQKLAGSSAFDFSKLPKVGSPSYWSAGAGLRNFPTTSFTTIPKLPPPMLMPRLDNRKW